MTWQPFILQNCAPQVRGYALGAYRPLTVRLNGETVRNPAFDNHSDQVLNLKYPDKPNYFSPAVKYSAILLARFLKTNFEGDRAEFVIVPSSRKGKVSLGLEKIVQYVCRTDNRFIYIAGGLTRHTSIEKLAKGGDRSLHVHLNSMTYREKAGSPRMKILLDDVMTTGNSMAGAVTVIRQVTEGIVFVPVALGKTTRG